VTDRVGQKVGEQQRKLQILFILTTNNNTAANVIYVQLLYTSNNNQYINKNKIETTAKFDY